MAAANTYSSTALCKRAKLLAAKSVGSLALAAAAGGASTRGAARSLPTPSLPTPATRPVAVRLNLEDVAVRAASAAAPPRRRDARLSRRAGTNPGTGAPSPPGSSRAAALGAADCRERLGRDGLRRLAPSVCAAAGGAPPVPGWACLMRSSSWAAAQAHNSGKAPQTCVGTRLGGVYSSSKDNQRGTYSLAFASLQPCAGSESGILVLR